MEKIKLGRTGLMVSASGFGALPIQRIPVKDASYLLRKAYDNGINYFDTANAYSDSEEKIGAGLSDVRDKIIISTKSGAKDYKTVLEHIQLSLRRMKTDYIDIIQLHNPDVLPDPDDPQSTYAACIEAKRRGYVRFIGITNHGRERARAAVLSGRYDTLQFPLTCIAPQEDIDLACLAHEHDMGFIAMKGMAGGLIAHAEAAFVFMKKYPFVVPIWGIQRESELNQFLALEKNPPRYEDWADEIEKERRELARNFCHGCGYCLPCTAQINIPTAARMSLLLRRSPVPPLMTEEANENMLRIEQCIHCNKCKSRCPYGLDTPQLLAENLSDYKSFRDGWLAAQKHFSK
ncbi:MAG: aldo/keto reductase [Phascolarctobacterium sp.]|nr:aldo/keto reductase [Phascolarctobacterium sp.]